MVTPGIDYLTQALPQVLISPYIVKCSIMKGF
jgi:hypothetical protein